jgi:hypothetical protein
MREIVCENRICKLGPKKKSSAENMANHILRGSGSYGLLPLQQSYEIPFDKLQTRKKWPMWDIRGRGSLHNTTVQMGGGSYGISPSTIPYQIPLEFPEKRRRRETNNQRGEGRRKKTKNLTPHLTEQENVGTYGIFPINDHPRPPLEYTNPSVQQDMAKEKSANSNQLTSSSRQILQEGSGSYGISPLSYSYEIPLKTSKKPKRKYKKRVSLKRQTGSGDVAPELALPEQLGRVACPGVKDKKEKLDPDSFSLYPNVEEEGSKNSTS